MVCIVMSMIIARARRVLTIQAAFRNEQATRLATNAPDDVPGAARPDPASRMHVVKPAGTATQALPPTPVFAQRAHSQVRQPQLTSHAAVAHCMQQQCCCSSISRQAAGVQQGPAQPSSTPAHRWPPACALHALLTLLAGIHARPSCSTCSACSLNYGLTLHILSLLNCSACSVQPHTAALLPAAPQPLPSPSLQLILRHCAAAADSSASWHACLHGPASAQLLLLLQPLTAARTPPPWPSSGGTCPPQACTTR